MIKIEYLGFEVENGEIEPHSCKIQSKLKLQATGFLQNRRSWTRYLSIVPRTFRWSVIDHVYEIIMHLG